MSIVMVRNNGLFIMTKEEFKKILIFLLLSIGIINVTYADASNFSIKIHNTEIKVKAPDGFFESSYVDPLALELFSKLMPSILTTHTLLVPKDDLANDKNRYMALVTITEFDKSKLSQKGFEKEIRDNVRKEQFTLMNSARGMIDKELTEKSKSISDEYDIDMSFKMNEMTPLGVFLDNKDSIGFVTILNADFLIEDEFEKASVVNATVMANVKNKLITIYVYSNYDSMKDVAWAKAKANEFVSLLLKSNK